MRKSNKKPATILSYLMERLQERSTWAGLALLGTGIGVHFDPDHMSKIIEMACDLIGAIYVLTKDKK